MTKTLPVATTEAVGIEKVRRGAAKDEAQDALMHGLRVAISNLESDTEHQRKVRALAIVQFRRVEKLFGFLPGSPFV